MKFRVFLHKRADEFLKGLKSEDRQRIVDKLKQLEMFQRLGLTSLRLLAIERYSRFTSKKW
jgi:mRNA-degrading endonuclease RelE of RelBE toxin-antitoxin system